MPNALDITHPSLAEALYPGVAEEPLYGYSLLDAVRQPTGHSPLAIKAWLRTVIDAFEVKPTNWAKSAGLAPSTINRFINNIDFNANLSASTIEKLKVALPSQIDSHIKSFWEKQAAQSLKQFSIDTIMSDAEMIGFVTDEPDKLVRLGDGRDQEVLEYASSLIKSLSIPIPKEYAKMKTFGFEVACDSYDPLYPDLTILICIPLISYGSKPPNGADVLVQERLDDRRTLTTIRMYVEDPLGRSWLMPLSKSSKESARAIFVDDAMGENGPKATFLVVAAYRYQRRIVSEQNSA